MNLSSRRRWSREELIVAFNLYCRTPFGRLHKLNPEIIRMAGALGRTPSALAMKLVNFGSLDPAQQARFVKGLSNVSNADREIWEEFHADWERLAYESQAASDTIGVGVGEPDVTEAHGIASVRDTERVGGTRIRLVQSFFRKAVLASYNYTCAVCQLGIPELLVASHIIPWSENVERRADPTNGLSLCALHDRAFDRGIIAVDDSYRILLSMRIKRDSSSRVQKVALLEIEGSRLALPGRFLPDTGALAYHRKTIFQSD